MPYGTLQADKVADSYNATLAPISVPFRNRIINGAMVIDQRNAGASVTPANAAYTLDRWQASLTQASKFTVQQNAGSVTLPVGFSNYLGITSSSSYSILSSDIFAIGQQIEGFNVSDLGWGTANAKTVTLSFQVYSSLTGTFGGAIVNTSTATRSYPFSYSIPVANTWTSISVTIAGDTTGSWATNNGTGMVIRLSLGSGSTYASTAGSWAAGNYWTATGATSVVGTSGATFYITGVQLEKGSNATSFDYRPYGTELSLCQRYYQYLAGTEWYGVTNYNGTTGCFSFQITPTMRVAPSISGSIGGITNARGNGYWASSPSFVVDVGQINSYSIQVTIGSTKTAGIPCNLDGGQFLFNAEL